MAGERENGSVDNSCMWIRGDGNGSVLCMEGDFPKNPANCFKCPLPLSKKIPTSVLDKATRRSILLSMGRPIHI